MPPKTHAVFVPGTDAGSKDRDGGGRTAKLSQLAPLQVPGASYTYNGDDIGAEVLPGGFRRSSGPLQSVDESRPMSITPRPAPGPTDGDRAIGEAGDQYLPDEFTFEEDTAHLKTMLASPTLGLSQQEWKSIPFSTRQKLKKDVEAAVETGSPLTKVNSYKDLPQSLTRALTSAPVSLAGSVTSGGGSSSGATSPFFVASSPKASMPIPAKPLSRRLKERAATMNYPAVPTPGDHPTRSTSMSSFPESPAFTFLNKWNDATSAFGGGSYKSRGGDYYRDEGEQVGDYVLGPVIGYGGFSEIKEAHTIDPETGQKVVRAVKLLRKTNPLTSRERLARVQSEFEHEVAIWKQLNHPNILRLLLVEEDDKATYCITERITGGTLFDFCRSMLTKPQDPATVLKYGRQLGAALLYLHDSMGIVHRDIKLENCLLEDKGSGEFDLLLCDFGMSEYFTRECDTDGDFDDHDMLAHGHPQDECGDASDGSSSTTTRTLFPHVIGPAETSAVFARYYANRRALSRRNSYGESNALSGAGNSAGNSSGGGGGGGTGTGNTAGAATSGSSNRTGPSLSRRSSISSNTNDAADSPGASDHFGSMPYASPELLRSDVPIIKPFVDIWSFGCTLHALLLARLPWHHSFPPKLKAQILAHEWDQAAVRRKWGDDGVALLAGCLEEDTDKRFTISQIMHHPFFEGRG